MADHEIAKPWKHGNTDRRAIRIMQRDSLSPPTQHKSWRKGIFVARDAMATRTNCSFFFDHQGQVRPAGKVTRSMAADPLAKPATVGCQLACPWLQSVNRNVSVPHGWL